MNISMYILRIGRKIPKIILDVKEGVTKIYKNVTKTRYPT